MKEAKAKLTLDRPAAYQIKVPGHLDNSWLDWVEGLTMTAEAERGEMPVTILRSTIDQAALQGLLRRLYAVGLPIISVIWVEGDCNISSAVGKE